MSPPSHRHAPPESGPSRLDTEAVYRALRSRIVNLELEPGTRLREEALAGEFGISRTPIRRVLDWLCHEGLVVITHGAGAAVAPIDYRELREVWALRVKVVELISDFVKLPASPEIVARLEGVLRDLSEFEATGDGLEARSLGPIYDAYHGVMLDIMDNGPLRQIYDQLYAQTARMFVQLLPTLDLEAEIAAVRDEVERTIEVCTAGSAQALAEVRTEHMNLVLQRLNSSLLTPLPAASLSSVTSSVPPPSGDGAP